METIEVELRPETLDEFVSVYHNEVSSIARSMAAQHGLLEAEDIAQGVWEKVCARWERDMKDLDATTTKKALRRMAKDVANKESLDYMYFTGSYYYSPAEVRSKLETCAWSELEKCPDVDARVDLQGAFKALAPGQRVAVYERYCLGITADRKSNRKRQEERGVDSITHYLNRGSGSRPAQLDDEYELPEVEHSMLPPGEFRGEEWGYGNEFGGDYR